MRAVPIHELGEEVRCRVSHGRALRAASGDASPIELPALNRDVARTHRAICCRASLRSGTTRAAGVRSPRP